MNAHLDKLYALPRKRRPTAELLRAFLAGEPLTSAELMFLELLQLNLETPMTASCKPTVDVDRDSHFHEWRNGLRSLFLDSNEYDLAAAIYSFEQAYLDGMTPQEALDDFDQWTQE